MHHMLTPSNPCRILLWVIGFHPEAKLCVKPRLSQSIIDSLMAMPYQFVFPIHYTSSHWSPGILLGLQCCVIPANSWGFRHIRKVRFNRRWSLECLTIYPSFFTPIAIAYIHPSIHSFISYCNICIKLHCIALERGAKSARAKDGAVLS
jgi:hypothetical protein